MPVLDLQGMVVADDRYCPNPHPSTLTVFGCTPGNPLSHLSIILCECL
jgi:SapB morphogen precursor RamS